MKNNTKTKTLTEEWQFQYLLNTAEDKKCITKVFNPSHNLISYKYFDQINRYQLYAQTKHIFQIFLLRFRSFIRINKREIEIKKLKQSFLQNCLQRKGEIEITFNVYQIIGKD